MFGFKRLCLVFLLTVLPLVPAKASEAVGTTVKASGTTGAYRLGRFYSQRRDDPVFFDDELLTEGASRLHVRFQDATMLYLGDHSAIVVDELVYEPNKKGSAFFHLKTGVFRMVSGEITKLAGSKFTVSTPFATIGVRGTDFWGHQSAEKLTLALLDDGELLVETKTDRISLTRPLSAIVIEKGKKLGQPFQLTPEQVEQAKKTIE